MAIWSTIRAFFTAGKGLVGGLSEAGAGDDPMALFHTWFREAIGSGIYLPESMALGTATPEGKPSVRLVLLKGYDERGFVFFTNYESRKAVELEANPEATLVFHWAILQRQIRIEGTTQRISKDDSEAYFHSRGRGSQVGAWASKQSQPLPKREELEGRVKQFESDFKGEQVPLPPYWGGYRLNPQSIEFWQGRSSRLHDRLKFEREGKSWTRERLYP